ncbi:hypothetical protein, partial [Burkholderia ubonensis]|uniref:hypothetical protein n=1 Tax=Burkholderia ubonensis TaxID=101571 RepID=UPI001E3FBBE9
ATATVPTSSSRSRPPIPVIREEPFFFEWAWRLHAGTQAHCNARDIDIGIASFPESGAIFICRPIRFAHARSFIGFC